MMERIIENSKIARLDHVFVSGIIKAESKFHKRAISTTKARGLMQVKIDAAYDGLCHIGYTNLANSVKRNPDLLYEVDINILSGCGYLRWILDKKNPKDWIRLMCYYNSGRPNTVVGSYIIEILEYYEKHSNISINKCFERIK